MSEVIEAPGTQNATAGVTQQHQLSVIEQAIRTGATADQLERLLQLQVAADNHRLEMMREKRRMDDEDRKSAALLSFRRDFSAFRGENIVVGKNKHVDRGRGGSFMQAEYHAIMQQISPALSRHGFGIRHDQKFGSKEWQITPTCPDGCIGWVWVTCFLEHKDGHAEILELEGPAGDQPPNTVVQNMQLTASYLKRQSTLAITGTATGGEDDENAMRRPRSNAPGQDAGGSDDLLDAGRDVAMCGMKALTAWWGALTAKQRTALNSEFLPLKKCAEKADKDVPPSDGGASL